MDSKAARKLADEYRAGVSNLRAEEILHTLRNNGWGNLVLLLDRERPRVESFEIIVVDQLAGFTPHWLSVHPMPFQQLWDQVREAEALHYAAAYYPRYKACKMTVTADYVPPRGVITFRANDENGSAQVFRYRDQ